MISKRCMNFYICEVGGDPIVFMDFFCFVF